MTVDGSRRQSRLRLAGLLLVPLLAVGGVLAGVWDFQDNLRRVEAAVVNSDEMVHIGDRPVLLGRQLTADLVDSGSTRNFTWVIADEESASAGLASGRFAAVVRIPRDFSAAATSMGGSAAQVRQATIAVETSPVGGLAEAAVGQSIADAAAKSLNGELTRGYLDNIFVGFSKSKEQLTTAAEGSAELVTGITELDVGIGSAAQGATALAAGLGALDAEQPTLQAGGRDLGSGSQRLVDGAGQLASSVEPVPAQVEQLATGAAALATGAGDADAGATRLQAGAAELARSTDVYATNMKAFADSMTAYSTAVDTYLRTGAGTDPAALEQWGATLRTTAGSLDRATRQLGAGAREVKRGSTALASGMSSVVTNTKLLSGGMQKLNGGMPELVSGVRDLRNGAVALDRGVDAYVAGVAQFAGGVTTARSGADQLATGLAGASDGTARLLGGSNELAAGLAEGAAQIPEYSDAEREALVHVIATPIDTVSLDQVVAPAAALVGILFVLALWAGALSSNVLVRPVDGAALISSCTTARLLARNLRTPAAVAVAQATVLTGLGHAFLDLDGHDTLVLGVVLVLVALAFAVVNYALVAWSGVIGSLVSVAMLVVTGVGALTAAAPPIFDSARGISALSPALEGMYAVLTGQSPVLPLAVVGGWMLAGLLAGFARLSRARQVPVSRLLPQGNP